MPGLSSKFDLGAFGVSTDPGAFSDDPFDWGRARGVKQLELSPSYQPSALPEPISATENEGRVLAKLYGTISGLKMAIARLAEDGLAYESMSVHLARCVAEAARLEIPPEFRPPSDIDFNFEKERGSDLFERFGHEFEARELRRSARTSSTRFTTDYAIQWGRRQGWTLVDRERYDARTQRHHDLEGGVDAIFDDGSEWRIGLQGAGPYQRNPHYAKFEAWGGVEKAKRRHLKVIYLEFERGNLEPLLREDWA